MRELMLGLEAKHEIVALTADHLKIDGATFEKIFNIRENNFTGVLDEKSANALFSTYLEQIELVIDAVDSVGSDMPEGE